MSYSIDFIKTKNLNFDNIYDLLETTDPNPENEIFIEKELMNKIITELKEIGLEFEICEGKDRDYFELNFPTYQVSMFNSEIAISIPYWDQNSNEGISMEVKQITNTLIENGFTGFDSQTEEFITEQYEFQTAFTESKTVVDNHMNSVTQSKSGNTWIYLGVGLGILIIGIVIWRIIK